MDIATSTVKANIDRIAATGLPIHISAFEIGSGSDTIQERIIREKFTMFWNHPKVIGVTYWGYVVGQTWRSGTGLLTSDGVERPALIWLKNFVKDTPNPPNDFPHLLDRSTDIKCPDNPGYMCVRTEQCGYRVGSSVFDLQGRCVERRINQAGVNDTRLSHRSSGLYMEQPAINTGNANDFNPIIELKR